MGRSRKRSVGIALAMMMAILPVLFAWIPVRAEENNGEADVLKAASFKAGDIIRFGHYEQDGNVANGKEEIEWEILKAESDRVMVVSKYALDCKPYNTELTNVTWEFCFLRKWLNNDFKNAAFTREEQQIIPTVRIENADNPRSKASGGNDTQDQIFCLSINEIETLIGYNMYNENAMWGFSQKMMVGPTQYAMNNGAWSRVVTSDDYYNEKVGYINYGYTSDVIGRRVTWWWLRSPGGSNWSAGCVDLSGLAGASEYCCADVWADNYAVRPAMYINIVSPSGIELDSQSLTLLKGESRKLTAKVIPSNAFDKSVSWSSSNTAVATVDSNGNVKAVSAGSTDIIAKASNGIIKKCPVKVIVNPTGIKLNKKSATIYYGNPTTLSATFSPSDVTEKSITWTSSNPTVATVNNGTVKATGKQAGTTTVTAKTVNGLTAKCEVTVYADNNPSNIFADVKYDSWQYKSAKPVYDKGYMTGKGKLGNRVIFSPDTNINRSQFATSLYSMAGSPAAAYKGNFSDVNGSDWYAKAVAWASDNGIVSGYTNGKFGVNDKATREQLALMFYKYAQYKKFDVRIKASTNLDRFTDAAKVDGWALDAMKWAVERGIISGKGNASAGYRLDPTKGATRAECAAMMNKFDEIYSKSLKVYEEESEEPLALPEEEWEDFPDAGEQIEDDVLPDEETEDKDSDEETEDRDSEEGIDEESEDAHPEDENEDVIDEENEDRQQDKKNS